MGNKQPKCDVSYFNKGFAKPPNAKKKYETIIFNYLAPKYRLMTQVKLYDFYLVDYHLYIETDEEHHFHSSNSTSRNTASKNDGAKIKNCLEEPASLLRISWFSINNNTYQDYITRCLKNYRIGKLYLASRDIYHGHEMIRDIDEKNIVYL